MIYLNLILYGYFVILLFHFVEFSFLTYKCGYDKCIDSLDNLSDEFVNCYYLLFISGFVYMILGMYFYEVIPQEYGVRKHPLFFLDYFIKSVSKKRNDNNYIDLKKSNKIDNKIEEDIPSKFK